MTLEKRCPECGKKIPLIIEPDRVLFKCEPCGVIHVLEMRGVKIA